jgi:acyl-coenzyme A thioesterase PaaI-like protein
MFFLGLQNFYGSLHGGAVAAAAETVSIACAKTVVAEDRGLSLGELSISYLSGAPMNVSFFLASIAMMIKVGLIKVLQEAPFTVVFIGH